MDDQVLENQCSNILAHCKKLRTKDVSELSVTWANGEFKVSRGLLKAGCHVEQNN